MLQKTRSFAFLTVGGGILNCRFGDVLRSGTQAYRAIKKRAWQNFRKAHKTHKGNIDAYQQKVTMSHCNKDESFCFTSVRGSIEIWPWFSCVLRDHIMAVGYLS